MKGSILAAIALACLASTPAWADSMLGDPYGAVTRSQWKLDDPAVAWAYVPVKATPARQAPAAQVPMASPEYYLRAVGPTRATSYCDGCAPFSPYAKTPGVTQATPTSYTATPVALPMQ
ncbi:MAG TPA: hypothetical protein VKY65_02795 [Alphaproteobacteria bacterium]|nr:hypothetical protein [Alphaproteobacteria bacterium]